MENTKPRTQRPCWCGGQELTVFSADYRLCQACGTLVSQAGLANDRYLVDNDESDFYGKTYWLDHMDGALRLPRIQERARLDLPERCCHWLQHLLGFRLPPARILELGAAHGAFVAMMRWAGYDATGLEMSPWVADLARRTFAVPMLVGPIERQGLAAASFDIVVANDVMEHLPDPLTTLQAAARLLKPDGFLLLQLPEFVEGKSYAERLACKERFLEHTKVPEEHLYLYSRRAAQMLFTRLGLAHLDFCKPMFDYDMYFAASRHGVPLHPPEEAAACLQGTPHGRLVLGLLDKCRELARLSELWQESEADRAARLVAMQELGRSLIVANEDREARWQILVRQNEIIRQQETTITELRDSLKILESLCFEGPEAACSGTAK